MQKSDLKSSVFCSKLPNVILKFLKKFWVIGLFSKVNIVKGFFDGFSISFRFSRILLLFSDRTLSSVYNFIKQVLVFYDERARQQYSLVLLALLQIIIIRLVFFTRQTVCVNSIVVTQFICL